MIATARFGIASLVLIAVIVLLLALSGLLAAAETSLIRTSKARAKSLADDGRRGARQLVRLVEHPESFLNPVLLLVLICQLVSATLVGVLASGWFGALGVLIGTVFEVVVVFVFFEAVPKNWAVHEPDRAALFAAPFVSAVVRFPPVRAISAFLIGFANRLMGLRHGSSGSNITESELLAMADVAHAEDVIETAERAFIHSIIDFGDAVVREVMVPRPDMVSLDAGVTVSEGLVSALVAGRSRLPVCDENVDDVIGIAYAKDLIRAEHDGHGGDPVRAHLRLAHFVPETKRLTAMLREMQEHKYHLSIVVDEYGGTAGLVTLEDLIEELVGEIVDEYDVEEPLVKRLPDGSVIVNARMSIDDASELLGADLPEGPWDTVGGLLLDLLGHIPGVGEAVEADQFRLVAQGVQGRRIGTVRIHLREVPPDADSDEDPATTSDDLRRGA